jgi:lincosamide nucleotidyltransferase A/C/D/E
MAETSKDDAVEILRLLKSHGIELWLDGGWGVDALLGEQTRSHQDIDIVIRHSDVARLDEALGAVGFCRVEGGRPFNFVMTDRRGGEIDER